MSQNFISNSKLSKPLISNSTSAYEVTDKHQQNLTKKNGKETQVNIENTTNQQINNLRIEQNNPPHLVKEKLNDEIGKTISKIQNEIDLNYQLQRDIGEEIIELEGSIIASAKAREASEDRVLYINNNRNVLRETERAMNTLRKRLRGANSARKMLSEEKFYLQKLRMQLQSEKTNPETLKLVGEINSNLDKTIININEIKEYVTLLNNIPSNMHDEEPYISINNSFKDCYEKGVNLDKEKQELREALELVLMPSDNINNLNNDLNDVNRIHNNDSDTSIHNNES